ncbi:AAA family ATPase [Candidatus Saccharibacteria bacterium]|nr:AAA family ATPase [Candidatus Saccharibacteria bacterium]
MSNFTIIGIGGTDGSGKDSLGLFLQEEYNWLFISVTDLLRDEAKRRGMRLSRDTLKMISAEWRAKHGLGVLVDKALGEYKKQVATHQIAGLVIASLRNPGEVDRVHELGGLVVWTDAPIEIRYQRAISRNKGTEDQVTFDEFKTEEQVQMHHSGDETTLNLSGVKAKADIFITNDTDNLEYFKTAVQKTLGHLL